MCNKKACRTTSRLINQTYKTHYESPKIKIFLILFFLFQILFLYLLTKQTRYLNFKKNNMKIKTFTIRYAETGNVIKTGLHYSEAYMLRLTYEIDDKNKGTYTPDFYEIIAEN